MKKNTTKPTGQDIADPQKDKKYLQSEETVFDLPEIKDIPGQENIQPPKFNQFADVTASSDDEEGKRLLDFEEEDEDLINQDANVSRQEKELLRKSADSMGSEDDEDRKNATLNNTDDDGDALNEVNDASGQDLDVPGSDEDDADEELGEEDEENNSYSLGGDRKD